MVCARCGGEATARVVRVRASVTVVLLLGALVASWVVLSSAFHDLIEGMERGALLGSRLALAPALLAAALVSWTLRLRRPVCAACGLAGARSFLVPMRGPRAERALAMPARRRVL